MIEGTTNTSPLIAAARSGSLSAIQSLLTDPATLLEDKMQTLLLINSWLDQRFVPLLRRQQFASIFLILLENLTANDANEAMWLAAKQGNVYLARRISQHTGVEFSAHIQGSALITAASNSFNEVVKKLLTLGDEIPSSYKSEALWFAATYDNYVAIAELLNHATNEISTEDKGEALISASVFGAYESLRMLLIRIGSQLSPKDIAKALLWAAANGDFNIVRELQRQVGHHISREANGHALLEAASSGHDSVVHLLLAQVIPDEHKDEALILATEENHFNVVELLLKHCEITPLYKSEALIIAAQKRHYHSFKALLGNEQGISYEDKFSALGIIIRALVRSQCQVVTNTCRAMLDELQKNIIATPLPDEHQAVALKVLAEVANPAVLNQYKRAQPSERDELDSPNDAEEHQDKRARR